MTRTGVPAQKAATLTRDCESADQVLKTEEKLDEHARDIIQSLAQRYHDERKQSGRPDTRSEQELREDDWYRAEAAFCAALWEQVQQACESSDEPVAGHLEGTPHLPQINHG
jgi:hypothetical protein